MCDFSDGISFHDPQENQSEVIYDTSGSSSYIEAVHYWVFTTIS